MAKTSTMQLSQGGGGPKALETNLKGLELHR